MQILDSLFLRPTPDLIESTYDTDDAAKANNMGLSQEGKRSASPSEQLMIAISEIRAGALDPYFLKSIAMNNASLIAATAALRRARNAGNMGKGGKGIILKRATQRTAGILAMTSATSAAVSGNLDSVYGVDPRVVDTICSKLITIFQCHGAIRLRAPILRPRPNNQQSGSVGGPAEVMNSRGVILLMPEDLTSPL